MSSASNGNPIEILLIDDNPAEIILSKKALEKADVPTNVNAANDGEEALQFLESSETPLPHLIFLDVNMPGMDGKKFLEIIKADERWRHIPVIILTSSSAPKDIKQCYALYASAYVVKPKVIEEYKTLLKALEGFWFTAAALPANTENA